ncbi:MAG: SGNH/GDSL hydrolase family protein [Candidatus Lernaella stagnicola]|nr:SGNH/GDSL hydrolase family protein [Candidatus Lernaella stagnicola]
MTVNPHQLQWTRKRKTAYAVLVFLLFFSLVELATRLAHVSPAATFYTDPRFFKGDPALEDRELFWLPIGRFEESIRLAKTFQDHPLIFCFGDSVSNTFYADRPFPVQLQESLLRLPGLQDLKLVNWSVDGYSSHQIKVLAGRAFAITQPDLVLVTCGWNDLDQARFSDRDIAAKNNHFSRSVLYAFNRSRAFGLLRRTLMELKWRIADYDTASENLKPRVCVREYRECLSDLCRLAKTREIPVILVSQASPDRFSREANAQYMAGMKAVAGSFPNATFIDIRPLLQTDSQNSRVGEGYFVDSIHPSNLGHKLIAERLTPEAADKVVGMRSRNGSAFSRIPKP